MEKIPTDLQDVAMPESDIARALNIAKPTNQKVREAADTLLKFEDEPATYLRLVNRE